MYKVGTEVEILPAQIQNLAQAHARMQATAGVRRDAPGDQQVTLIQRQLPGASIVFPKEFYARG